MLLVRKQAKLQEIEEIEFQIPLARKNLGKLNNHTKGTQGITMTVPELLYVDDGMLNMTNREDLIKMSSIVEKQFARIGLQMHVGVNGKPSKSVAMFFPATAKETPDELTEQEQPFSTDTGGTIQFVTKFQYLGSWVTQDLKDLCDVKSRICKGNNKMHKLQGIFDNKYLPLEYKKNIYITHVLGTTLFGCESWAMDRKEKDALEVFHHKNIRKILKINMFQVRNQHIKNLQIRERLKIHNITDFIIKRQLGWIQNLGELYNDKLQLKQTPEQRSTFHVSKLLFAWIDTPNQCGIQRTLRKQYKEILTIVYDHNKKVKKNGSFNEWRPDIENKTFKQNINRFWRETFPWPQSETENNETETETETETEENNQSAGAPTDTSQ